MATESRWNELKAGWRRLSQGLQRFWQWWWGELVGMLPESWQSRLEARGSLLLIEYADNHCRVRFGNGRSWSDSLGFELAPDVEVPGVIVEKLRKLSRQASDRILVVDPSQLLVRRLRLPLATEANLNNVLRFEMDRHTPFKADQVYYASKVLARDSAARQLSVELYLTLRSALDPLLGQLTRLGIQPQIVSPATEEPASPASMINLLPESARAQGSQRLRLARRLRALLWLALIGLAVWLPMQWQAQRLTSLTDQIDALKTQANESRRLAAQVEQLREARDYLLAEQARAPEPLLLLQQLTELLPDHTWISRFELRDGRVRLDGESSDASSLIRLLEQSSYLSDASFASPVTVNPRTGKDRFSISARMGPEEGR